MAYCCHYCVRMLVFMLVLLLELLLLLMLFFLMPLLLGTTVASAASASYANEVAFAPIGDDVATTTRGYILAHVKLA